MAEKVTIGNAELLHGDCLEVMAGLPGGCADAVICDPPYGTVKGLGEGDEVDHGMAGRTGWDDALEPALFLAECNRLLRMNGAMVLFSQEPYTSRLITESHWDLPFSYRMTWLKDHFANALVAKKAPVSYTEDVLVFAKRHTKHDFNGFHPLRPYAEQVMAYIGKSKAEVFADMGHQGACHFMRHNSTQFSLCTERTYSDMIRLYGIDSMAGFIEFADLAPVDRDYRRALIKRMNEEAPRRFNLPEGQKYKSNVLQYRKDYSGHHPTQKPVALMEDLVKTYTNAGETVLDFTMGSGSTGVACANTGRRFIGIEKDHRYFVIACERIENEQRQAGLAV